MKNKSIYKFFIIVLLVTSSPVSVFAGGGWDLPEPAPYLTNGIKLVNLDNSGNKKNFESEYNPPSISADGRYVSFYSESSELVDGDTNNQYDVFVRDTVSNTIIRASVSNTEEEATGGGSFTSAISANGRYVVFSSDASNLVSDDNNGVADVFVRDLQEGTTVRVSVSSAGTEGNSDSSDESLGISANGRYVVFNSDASNLVSDDNNGVADVFVRDLQEGTTVRVNVANTGDQADGYSRTPSISANGRYVVFSSDASNLVSDDNNGVDDVFVRDLQEGTTVRVSVANTGDQADGYSQYPSISANGRYVVFNSDASNLVSDDNNGVADVFVRDLQENTTTRVSVSSSGAEANDDLQGDSTPSISADGRYITFSSFASNLVDFDTNDFNDIFLRDIQSSVTTRITADSLGRQGNSYSFNSSISSDGKFIVFESVASNLVDGDMNDVFSDIFIFNTDESVPEPGSSQSPAPATYESSGGIHYGCKDPKATNYELFSAGKPELCKYEATTPTPVTQNKTGMCSLNQQLTQNLRAPSRNGIYNTYTKGIVKEAHILQAHLNRLGFNSGKEDGILGPISTGAIKRMQTFLGTKPDGYVGPITRELLNNSCGVNGLQNWLP